MKLTYTLTRFAIFVGTLLPVAHAASAEDDQVILNYYNPLRPPTSPLPPPLVYYADNPKVLLSPRKCGPGPSAMLHPMIRPNCFISQKIYDMWDPPICPAASRLPPTPNAAPTHTTMTTTASSATSSTPIGTSFSYLGCEDSEGSRRALTGARFSRSNMTPFLCQSLCSEYQFAGVESGTECYCGNSLRNSGASGSRVPDSHCHLPCGGDSGKKCGGHWTMSLYAKSAPPRSVNQRNRAVPASSLPSSRTCADRFQAVPLRRAYNPISMDHFYTTSILEFDSAVGALGYTNRGFAGHIWTTQQPGTVPLYRLWNPVIQDHLYTTSTIEQDDAVANLKYMKKGVYPGPMCNAAPLYRLFSSSGSDHLYTRNAAERQGLIRPGASTYADEGIAAFAFDDPFLPSLSVLISSY